MNVIIAGSRTFNDYKLLHVSMATVSWFVSAVLSGGARGADILGEKWAEDMGIPIHRFEADWDTYGKRAGYIRNIRMLEDGGAKAVIVFWDTQSRGTKHLINEALLRTIPVLIIPFKKGE